MWTFLVHRGDTENQEAHEALSPASYQVGMHARTHGQLWKCTDPCQGNRECAVFRDLDLLSAREEEAERSVRGIKGLGFRL